VDQRHNWDSPSHAMNRLAPQPAKKPPIDLMIASHPVMTRWFAMISANRASPDVKTRLLEIERHLIGPKDG
jgi:hypothetical protein